MTLVLREDDYVIFECSELDTNIFFEEDIISVVKNDRGFTVICSEKFLPEDANKVSRGWVMFEPVYVPEIDIYSVVYTVAGRLAESEISAMVINEWEGVCLLVKKEDARQAINIMVNSGLGIAE